PKMVLHKDYEMSYDDLVRQVEGVKVAHDPVEEIVSLAFEKGIRNALTVLEKTDNAFIVDEVHRQLIEAIREGAQVADLKEGIPPWHVLHMTLFEISLPATRERDEPQAQLAKLVGMME